MDNCYDGFYSSGYFLPTKLILMAWIALYYCPINLAFLAISSCGFLVV
jgi:hypothetical protein